jgi:hypothetical protein
VISTLVLEPVPAAGEPLAPVREYVPEDPALLPLPEPPDDPLPELASLYVAVIIESPAAVVTVVAFDVELYTVAAAPVTTHLSNTLPAGASIASMITLVSAGY